MLAKKISLPLVGTALTVLCLATAAWACTFQPRILSINERMGSRQTAVSLTGEGMAPNSTVQIRWNTISGPKLADVVSDGGGRFSASIVIPDVSPGVYSILVVTQESGVARSAFEVTSEPIAGELPGSVPQSPVQTAVSTDLWQGYGSSANASAGTFQASAGTSDLSDSRPLGLGLVAAGAMALFLVTAVASVRRSRLRG